MTTYDLTQPETLLQHHVITHGFYNGYNYGKISSYYAIDSETFKYVIEMTDGFIVELYINEFDIVN